MIDFSDIEAAATGIGQICFYLNGEDDADTPFLSIGFCRDGFWTLPVPLLAAGAVQARAANCRLGFLGPASAEAPPAIVSIVFQTGERIADYALTAWGLSPAASARFLCVVGGDAPAELHGFAGCCVASDWHAALAPIRLLAPASGLIGYDLADAIAFLSGRITWCETWRLDEDPCPRALESDAVWLGFSNRLLLTEVDAAARAIEAALPSSVELNFHASAETTPAMQVDAMLAKAVVASPSPASDQLPSITP